MNLKEAMREKFPRADKWKQFIKWDSFPPSYRKDDVLPWLNPKEFGVQGYEFQDDICEDYKEQKL